MRFPLIDQVALPAVFQRYIPGELHHDGKRYLPHLIFRLSSGLALSVVDRHHYVNSELVGSSGSIRLVFLLGPLRVQPPGEQRQGIAALPDERGPHVSAPQAWGRISTLPSWEVEREHLPYQQVYTELILDVGDGTVGVRTSMTAPSLAEAIGTEQLQVGDWLHVLRAPRVDVIEFRAD